MLLNTRDAIILLTLVCGTKCKECDNKGACTKCIDGMYLSSGVCYFCPDGKYFDKTTNSCLNCGTNCNELCSYRVDCFKCNGTQSFSLLQMKCVNSCSDNEVMIQSEYIHGLKVCRNLEYYINPSSESILELGTKRNPYKNINLVFIELFNFVDASSKSVSIRLSLGDAHILVRYYEVFGTLGIINNFNATVQPYNELSNIYSDSNYDNSSRSTIIFRDYDISFTSSTSMFNLLSYLSLNESIINSFTSDVVDLIRLPQIGYFVINSAITFMNIRFEDSFIYIPNQKAIWFAPSKLESKAFTLINVDIKCTSTILYCYDPINIIAKNINIIDYANLESGFQFPTQCDYAGATTIGEILIDGVYFTKETPDIGLYRIGPFLDIRSPFNITISNSKFKMTNNVQEDFDTIVIQDSGECSPDDSITQNILIVNNTFTLDEISQDAFINLILSFSNANKRNKNIKLLNNTFFNIVGPENSILEIDYYSKGTVTIIDNAFNNCSTTSNLFSVNANDVITISNLSFNLCDITREGLVYIGNAASIFVNTFSIKNTTYILL